MGEARSVRQGIIRVSIRLLPRLKKKLLAGGVRVVAECMFMLKVEHPGLPETPEAHPLPEVEPLFDEGGKFAGWQAPQPAPPPGKFAALRGALLGYKSLETVDGKGGYLIPDVPGIEPLVAELKREGLTESDPPPADEPKTIQWREWL